MTVPKDLSRVKTKLVFNLTKRQVICFGCGILVGLPVFFLLRSHIPASAAALIMMIIMMPFFLFAMYERDGMPLEKVLMNMITVKFRRPHLRLYETENLYEKPEAKPQAAASGKKRRKKKMSGSRKKKTASGGKNLGRNMNERRPFSEGAAGSAELERRNAQAGIYATAQRGGRNRARQG